MRVPAAVRDNGETLLRGTTYLSVALAELTRVCYVCACLRTTPSRYKSAPGLMSNDDGQEQWHGADVHPGHLEAEVRVSR